MINVLNKQYNTQQKLIINNQYSQVAPESWIGRSMDSPAFFPEDFNEY